MKFEVSRTSDDSGKRSLVDINNIDEMVAFIEENGTIIISRALLSDDPDITHEIEIYDDYRS